MPILGLTDQAPQFPQIGVIRKGAPKPENGKAPGKDLDYFRFDSTDAAATQAFAAIYGEQPKAVHCYVPFASVGENFDAWREEWTASSLKHRCDGQTCVRWLTPNGKYSDEAKPCPGGCKPAGRLKVIVPELKRMAYVMVLTTSIHDIITIHANLSALANARGDLRGIPLLLRRVPREISTPNGKERARRVKHLITIEAAPQWVELQLTAQEQAALPAAVLALPPAPDDEEEWEDEEHPFDHTESGVPTGASPGVGKVAIEYASAETISAIRSLWPKFGIRKQGQLVPFETILRQNKWTLDTWPAERAAKTLADLQRRALAAQPVDVNGVPESPLDTEETAEAHEAEVI